MEQNETHELVKLGDSRKSLTHQHDDVRGYTVRTSSGEEIGKVEELLVDVEEEKVRFLIVASGGFLGLAKDKTYIPVDVVKSITKHEGILENDGEVLIDRARERIAGAPAYDPDLTDARSYYEDVYGYYSVPPYWSAGYVYPGHLHYPR